MTDASPENPFRIEIAATFVGAPLVLALEAWRRWGDLLDPAALDDALVLGAALVVAFQLHRRNPRAPVRWLFVCGGAWFLMSLSLWGSVRDHAGTDPSGFPMPVVIASKVVGWCLVTAASRRALRRCAVA